MSLAIRPIRIDEASVLQDFLREHWNAQHAFVHSAKLLLWQHGANPFKSDSPYADDELTFLGAWDGSELLAVLGEIPLPFSVRGRVAPGAWLALWKNRAEGRHASAGIQLFQRATSRPLAFVGGIGVNPRVRRAYQLFRFRLCDDLPLYVVLNPEVRSALVVEKPTWSEVRGTRLFARSPAPARAPGLRVEAGPPEAGEWDAFWSRARRELVGTDRSFAYLRWRYLTHPHYHYEWLRVSDERGALAAAAVYRAEHAADEQVLHVVEFLGAAEAAAQLAAALCGVMRNRAASFLGFRCARSASFHAWREVGGGVYGKDDPDLEIPSLFQPVVPAYRPLAWSYRVDAAAAPVAPEDCYVTRSDGDQDRPSLLGPASG